jgi:hypothetical protein
MLSIAEELLMKAVAILDSLEEFSAAAHVSSALARIQERGSSHDDPE